MKDRNNLYRDAFEVELAGVPVCMAQPRGVGAHRFLLLHGNPGSMHLDFGALVGPLGRLGQVAAFDMPGLGRSPTPNRSEELSLETLAEVALAAIDHLKWERTVVVGHSHGGGVAQRLAARWPVRIAGLVLIGTLGAIGMITSGILFGKRKRERDRSRQAHDAIRRRVQWDVARSRLMF